MKFKAGDIIKQKRKATGQTIPLRVFLVVGIQSYPPTEKLYEQAPEYRLLDIRGMANKNNAHRFASFCLETKIDAGYKKIA